MLKLKTSFHAHSKMLTPHVCQRKIRMINADYFGVSRLQGYMLIRWHDKHYEHIAKTCVSNGKHFTTITKPFIPSKLG